MQARFFAVFALAGAISVCGASNKKPLTARGENQDVILTATLYNSPDEIKELIGDDLGKHYIVVDVHVEPKYGKDVVLDRDDFVLRTDKDGEKAQPYAASQVAGRGALIVGQESHTDGIGSPGWTDTTLPVVKGGGGTAGSAPAGSAPAKPNPLKKTLDEKILPEGKTSQPVGGLLYFPMEKQKDKDLELIYGDKENQVRLRFKR